MGLDYVVALQGELPAREGIPGPAVRIRYIPDDFVLSLEILHVYLRGLSARQTTSLEEIGAWILGDLDAELLPRWIQIALTTEVGGHPHRVTLEQRKPGWENRLLIARIAID
jgi:NADPH-dependent 7-cyano-7-deazaguanine reductase QueF